MEAELKRKTTRTVHGEKVVRLRLDVPYQEVKEAERAEQDMLEWLDTNVDSSIMLQLGPFEDGDQSLLKAPEGYPEVDFEK